MKLGDPQPYIEFSSKDPEVEDVKIYRVHRSAEIFGLYFRLVDGGILINRSEPEYDSEEMPEDEIY